MAEVFSFAGYRTSCGEQYCLALDFGLAQGLMHLIIEVLTIKTFDSAIQMLHWTGGVKLRSKVSLAMSWNSQDLLPPEETRGVFVPDPSVDVPMGYAAKIRCRNR